MEADTAKNVLLSLHNVRLNTLTIFTRIQQIPQAQKIKNRTK